MSDTAKQVDFLLPGYINPNTGEALSGGEVYFYTNGTTMLTNVWLDRNKDNIAPNPITLDSVGQAEVFGDYVYKCEVYNKRNSDGSQGDHIETLNGLEITPSVDATVTFSSVEWLERSEVATPIANNMFIMVGDLTDAYQVGRAIRITGSLLGDISGHITSSVFTTLTTVTVEMTGNLYAETLNISLGLLAGSPQSLPAHGASHISGTTAVPIVVAGVSDGLMSHEDKTKINTIETGAEVNNISDGEANALTGGAQINIHSHDMSSKENVGVAQGLLTAHEDNHPIPTNRDDRNEVIRGDDDNYVTDAEKAALASVTGVNTGDQIASGVPVTDSEDYFIGSDVETILAEIGEVSRTNGYDLTNSDSLPDISFDNPTRTFSASVQSGQSEFHFWSHNKKIVKTTTQSVVIPNVSGIYYIVFDNSGTLIAVTVDAVSSITFYEHAITGLVYWNATAGSGMIGDERHGILMDARTHHYNHSTTGARYEAGLDITGLTDGSTTYTNTSSGYFWDEDIRHTVALQSNHPFLYRLGTTGEWTATTPDNLVGFENGTADVVFNEWTGSTWQLTQSAAATDYIIYFMMATPDINGYPVKKIIGQHGYASRNKARAAIETELSKLVTDGLPSTEFIFLSAYIVRRNGDLENLADGNTHVDLRNIKGIASSSPTASFAADITTNTTNFNGILSATDTTTQTALETIDDIDADDISDISTTNKFVTAAQLTNINNQSGNNTGDQSYGEFIHDGIRDAVITTAPSENAVFDALAAKSDISATAVVKMKIAIIGDSLTDAVLSRDAWPSQFKKYVNQAGFNVDIANFAVGGSTFFDIKNTYQHDWTSKTQQLKVIEYEPDMIFVCLGINDYIYEATRTASQVTQDGKDIYDTLKAALPSATIVFVPQKPHDVDTKGIAPASLLNKEVTPHSQKLITFLGKSDVRCNTSAFLDANIETATLNKHTAWGTGVATLNSYYDEAFYIDYWKVLRCGMSVDNAHPDSLGHTWIANQVITWFAKNNPVDNDTLVSLNIETPNVSYDIDEYYDAMVTGTTNVATESSAAYVNVNIFERFECWFYQQRPFKPHIDNILLPTKSSIRVMLNNCHPNKQVWFSYDTSNLVSSGMNTTALGSFGYNLETLPSMSVATHNVNFGVVLADGSADIYVSEFTVYAKTYNAGDIYFVRGGLSGDNTTMTSAGISYPIPFSNSLASSGNEDADKFTAPVRGLYQFNIHMRYEGITGSTSDVLLKLIISAGVSTSPYFYQHVDDVTSTADKMSITVAQILYLNAGSTVTPNMLQNGSSGGIVKAQFSQWSCSLIRTI